MPLPKQLDVGEFPAETEYLWDWWCQLRECNGDDFSAQAVKAWFDLQGITPEPWEVQAVMGVWRELVKSRQS